MRTWLLQNVVDTGVEVVAYAFFIRGAYGFILDAITFGEWFWK